MLFGLVSLLLLSSVSTYAQFNIQVVFTTAVSAQQKASFDAAAARWSEVITGDIGTTITIRAGQRVCGQPPQAQALQVDDILIFAAINAIDGPGKVLGSAGPCGFDNNGRVRLGSMQFDEADVANLLATNRFTSTVLHEMGHIIGIGGDWGRRGLVSPTAQGTPFTYLGANGPQAQADVGGVGKPIVEDVGGGGTARVHWKEAVYKNELMTGFISGATQPLSKLTVRSLIDLGYQVNVNKADDFSIAVGATKAPVGAGVTKAPSLAAVTKTPTVATKAPSVAGTKSPTIAGNGFNIDVIFTTAVSKDQKDAFNRAVAKWQSVITGDIGNTVTLPAGTNICGQVVAQNIQVDDIVIFAAISPIDGAGRILGQAGPCGFDNAGRIRLGSMEFDSDDVANLLATGKFDATILHEMGHVLGLGTDWERRGLISPTAQGTPFLYQGLNGNQGQKDIGGAGQAVIEDIGGAGTARGHWKEAVYKDELMTGFLSGANTMSRLTVQALKDLQYVVDLTKAETFVIPTPAGRRLRDLKDKEDMALLGHRDLQDAEWEGGFKGSITWEIPTEDKELTEDGEVKSEWEVGFTGEVTFDIPAEAKPVDTGAVAGGVIGGLAVVGAAAAFVLVRRRKNSLPATSAQMTSQNPMFNNNNNNNYA